MNKLLKNMALAMTATAAMSTGVAQAADMKIGVVNMPQVIQSLPHMAQIKDTIEAEFKDQFAALKKLEDDIKFQVEKHKRESALMSPEQLQELEGKIQQMQQQYGQTAQPLKAQLDRRQAEEQNKVLALVKQAIDSIAANEKFDLVLQKTSVAFNKDSLDISNKVIEQVSKTN